MPLRASIALHYANPIVPIIGDAGDAVQSQRFASAHRCYGLAIASADDVALAANLQRYVLAVAALTLLQETIKPSSVEQSP